MMEIQLRDYQQKFLHDVLNAFSTGAKRVCGAMPTGAGKTCTVAYLIKQLQQQNKIVYWLTHRKELIFQVSDNFTEWDILHSYIAAGRSYDKEATVFICSVQTLARKQFNNLPIPDLIIADECHLSAAPQYKKCILSFNCKALGISATPIRLDRKPLGEIYDSLVMGPTIKDLIQQGYLAYPRIFVPPKTANLVDEHRHEWKVVGGDYSVKHTDQFFSDNAKVIHGDVLSHVRQYLYNKPTLVFCNSIQHAADTVNLFNENGLAAVLIEGSMTDDKRKQILQDFKSGKFFYLMSVNLLIEGVDIVDVAGVVFLRLSKSLTVYLQSAGRGLRISQNKRECIFLDHVNLTEQFGPVFISRYFTLDGYGQRNKKDTISGISLKLCLKCGTYVPNNSLICKNCGYVFTKQAKKWKIAKEQLCEITIESANKLIEEQCQKIINREKRKMGFQKTVEQFKADCEAKGWKFKDAEDLHRAFERDKENTRIFKEGSRDELIGMFAKRKGATIQQAVDKADETLAKRAELAAKRSAGDALHTGKTLAEILEYVKREKPEIKFPEAYAQKIFASVSGLGQVLEHGTESQKAEASSLVGSGTVAKDKFTQMLEFAKSGNMKDENGSPKVLSDEEAEKFARNVVRKQVKADLESGDPVRVRKAVEAMHISNVDKYVETVLAGSTK